MATSGSTPATGASEARLAVPSTVAYRIEDSLYLNITNRCTARCVFCPRQGDFLYRSQSLRLAAEPTVEEVVAVVGRPEAWKEIVFCGYGEPTAPLAVLCEVADWAKSHRARRIRLNTNGHGNLIHGRDILPDINGRVDAVSVSLNSADPEQYVHLMGLPPDGNLYFMTMVDFARRAPAFIPEVRVTVVALPEVDIARAREFVAREIGVPFHVRPVF